MGAALPGRTRRHCPAARAHGRVGADRRRNEGVVCPMSLSRTAAAHACACLMLLCTPLTWGAAGPAAAATAPAEGAYSTRLPAGRFGKVTVYIPEGKPRSVAIF